VRPLRFCHFTTFYPPFNFGGDGIGIQRLSRGLAKRGHHVTVVHDVDAYRMLSGGRDPEPEVDPFGVEVIPMRSGLGSLSCLLTQQTGHPVVNKGRIERILHEGRYDVINYHNLSLVGGPGLMSMGDAVKLYMAHEHWLVCESHVLWRHGRERCEERECLRCVLNHKRPPQAWRHTGALERHGRNVDAWIAMSEFSRDKHREYGFPFEMEVLPYFLPDPETGPLSETGRPELDAADRPQRRPYFLFVGRLEQIKGVQDVLPILRDYPEADLLVTGTGEYEEELKRQAAGIENVRFLGRVPDDELMRTYRHAEALIVPSLCYETFGIILIEAFTNGVPVIARRLGPFPEIVAASGGGELFETRDDLLAAMRRIQEDPAHREQLAANGWRAYLERWTESAVIPRYLELVRRAAERRGDVDVLAAMSGPSHQPAMRES
jgi:glycosyltransferase involved in cell wall biosynthesis